MANWRCFLHPHITMEEAINCAWERNKLATRLAMRGVPPEAIAAVLATSYINVPAVESGDFTRN